MRAAIAGCGTMGRLYADRLHSMEGIDLTAVFDIQIANAQRLAGPIGCAAYDSFDDMLRNERIDVVCITLPTFLHKKYVRKAAAACKAIICEKPIASARRDAEEMIRACQENGSRLFVAHVVRFFPEYRQLRDAAVGGEIGSVGVVHTRRAGPHPGAAKGWYRDSAKSGGVIMDLLIHDLDFLRWTLGEVKSIYAARRTTDTIDYSAVTLQFKSGAIANAEGIWGFPGPFTTEAEFAGSAGLLRCRSGQQQPIQLYAVKDAGENGQTGVVVPHNPNFRDPYYQELEHFISCLKDSVDPLVTAEDGLKALELALAAIRSAELGTPVQVSAAEEGMG